MKSSHTLTGPITARTSQCQTVILVEPFGGGILREGVFIVRPTVEIRHVKERQLPEVVSADWISLFLAFLEQYTAASFDG